jgi:3-oxoacyl-[acyl-carrier-protein] synthase-3
MTALKYAYLNVKAGNARRAVATGSELASSWLQAGAFQVQRSAASPEKDPYVTFNQEFLRWMLSDGAGAVAIEPQPRPGTPSLRIDWLDIASFANDMETCMYCGGVKQENGNLQTWRELQNFDNVWKDGYLNLTQDVKLLKEKLIPVGFRRSFERLRQRHPLAPDKIDWALAHLSSEFFRQPTYDLLAEMGFTIPPEKWFSNLESKGNTGSASILIMLEELWNSGALKPGHRLLVGVPESARFTFAYMHCTVV